MNHQTLLDEVTRTSIQLILNEPFYGHFFSNLVREISDRTGTLAVSVRRDGLVTLSLNENFWNEFLKTDAYKYGVIKHEILHVLFKHILMIGDFTHREIANVAMDIVVNQYIEKEQLPGEPVLLESFPGLNLKPHESVDYYYKKLLKLYRSKENNAEPDLAFEALKRYLSSFSGGEPEQGIGDHRAWKEFSEAEKRVIQSGIDSLIDNVYERIKNNPQSGNLPEGIRAYLKKHNEVDAPTLDWRRVLRLFSGTSSKTFLKNTIKRVSKRYETVPGIKVKHKNKLLVAIDTSGSTSSLDHQRFFNEIQHIYRQGAEIMILECDDTIKRKYPYRGQMPDYVSGRGWTSFEEPLIFANEEYLPDAVIYFTDGYASAPQTIPRVPLLWVITSGGIQPETPAWTALPGRKVAMNKVR
ncbi:MAG: hypothetical protein KDC85_01130 [Saprospiraceae bacterium]|nr:hypothetical protein [Saprospiraceae bacterium]MCB9326848.1 hypothetical protein [Lewinellaceae bacterium]